MTYLNSFQKKFTWFLVIIISNFCAVSKGQDIGKNTFEFGFISSKGLITVQFQRNLFLLNDNISVYGNTGIAYTPGSHESEPEISNTTALTVGSGFALNLNKFRLGIGAEYNKVIREIGKDVDTNYDFISINSYLGFYFGGAGIKLSYLPRLYTNQEYEIDNKNGFGFTIFTEF